MAGEVWSEAQKDADISDLEAASVEELYDLMAGYDEEFLRWLIACGRAALIQNEPKP